MSKIRKVLFAITLFIIGALGIITAHFIEILFYDYSDMYVLSLISAITISLAITFVNVLCMFVIFYKEQEDKKIKEKENE